MDTCVTDASLRDSSCDYAPPHARPADAGAHGDALRRLSGGAGWLVLGGTAVALGATVFRMWRASATQPGFDFGDGLIVVAVLAMIATALGLRRQGMRARVAEAASRRLLESACDAVLVIAPNRHIVQVSPRAAALFGYAPPQAGWSAAQPGAARLVALAGRLAHRRAGSRQRRDQRRVFRTARNGTTLALEIATGPAAGPPAGAMALLIRDVTRARRVREELRAKEAHLRLIVEQMPAILWTTNNQLHITSTVGAGLAAVDLKPAEVIGMSMLEPLGRSDSECTPISAHVRALRGETLSHEMAWMGRTFQVRVEPLRNPERRITGTIGVVLDVTDHKQTIAELKARVRQQAVIAMLGQQVLAGGDLDGLLQDATRAVRETLEVELCELLELAFDRATLRQARARAGPRVVARR